jgi:hypothetical protein
VFNSAVDKCSETENAKIQGLCAENLVSHMLNSSPQSRNKLYEKHKTKIQFWINDCDAWVLEHVFRLFHQTRKEPMKDLGQDVDPAQLVANAPLLGDCPNWVHMTREEFLAYIEDRKKKTFGW